MGSHRQAAITSRDGRHPHTTSAGKAAALLGTKDPAVTRDAHERWHVVSNAKTLATGRLKPLCDEGVKPLAVVLPAIAAQLGANARLMASYGLRPTSDPGAGMEGCSRRDPNVPGCAGG